MNKLKIKFILDVIIFLDFMLVMISGFNRTLRQYHFNLAWLLVFLIFVHLLFNLNWIKHVFLNFFRKEKT